MFVFYLGDSHLISTSYTSSGHVKIFLVIIAISLHNTLLYVLGDLNSFAAIKVLALKPGLVQNRSLRASPAAKSIPSNFPAIQAQSISFSEIFFEILMIYVL